MRPRNTRKEDREELEDALEEFKSAVLNKFDAEIEHTTSVKNLDDALTALHRLGVKVELPARVSAP